MYNDGGLVVGGVEGVGRRGGGGGRAGGGESGGGGDSPLPQPPLNTALAMFVCKCRIATPTLF